MATFINYSTGRNESISPVLGFVNYRPGLILFLEWAGPLIVCADVLLRGLL